MDTITQAKDDLLRVLAGEIRDKDDDLEAATTRLEVRTTAAHERPVYGTSYETCGGKRFISIGHGS